MEKEFPYTFAKLKLRSTNHIRIKSNDPIPGGQKTGLFSDKAMMTNYLQALFFRYTIIFYTTDKTHSHAKYPFLINNYLSNIDSRFFPGFNND